jgi:alpha-glucosidase
MSPEPVEWRPAQPERWRTEQTVGQANDWRVGSYAAMIARRI